MALSHDDTLTLPIARGARIVRVSHLRVISSRDNYSEITLADGSQVVLRKTLKAWQAALPSSHFLRVHRTLIVNLASVVRYERGEAEQTSLYLAGLDAPVCASRRTWPQLRDRLALLHAAI